MSKETEKADQIAKTIHKDIKQRRSGFRQFVSDMLNMHDGMMSYEEIDAMMLENTVIHGPNMWILCLAALIASIGLNMNSTAVIIGAMLISPDSTYTAVIAGGTFDGNVENNKSTTITGGTFNGQVRNSGVIENGQFNGAVNNYEGTIKGGTFYGSVKNSGECDLGTPFHIGTISGGTFNGNVTNEEAGRISGGTFNGSVYGTFYTVAFVSNGGTAVPNQKYANTPVTAPAVSRAGYTLVGWYTDEACTAAYDFTQPVMDSVTLYAKWEAAPRYYYNSGTTTDTDNGDEDKKGSPKTFDPGAGIYAVSAALSLTGTAWIGRKRH